MRDKHQVNVKKNAVVNFQIGLIAALTFVYVMFEVFTTSQTIVHVSEPPLIDDDTPTITVFTVIPDNPPKKEVARVERRKKKVIIRDKIKKISNDTKEVKKSVVETPDKNTPVESVNNQQISATSKPVKEAVPARLGNINIVEFAPVFPGCEKLKTNKDRVVCFQKKIQRMISRKFNSGLGEDLALKGQQKIHVLFEIDAFGNVRNIKARAPHPRLEKEAIRVTKQLPKMIPARQGKNNVAIQYALPIVFDVR